MTSEQTLAGWLLMADWERSAFMTTCVALGVLTAASAESLLEWTESDVWVRAYARRMLQ